VDCWFDLLAHTDQVTILGQERDSIGRPGVLRQLEKYQWARINRIVCSSERIKSDTSERVEYTKAIEECS